GGARSGGRPYPRRPGRGRALDHRRAQDLDVGRSGRRARGRGVPDRPGRRETRRVDGLPRADGRPGVTVRPIRQMTGGSSFNEVYLDGVVLGDEYRLGPVGQGWKVALTVLAAERLDAGNLGLANADQAVELARNLGRPLDAVERDRVADLITRSYVQRITGMRVAEAIVAGQEPGP